MNLLFNLKQIKYLKALQTLGMSCLVMSEIGSAFASSCMLCMNDDKSGRKQKNGFNPHAKGFCVEILNNYCENWEDSCINIEETLKRYES